MVLVKLTYIVAAVIQDARRAFPTWFSVQDHLSTSPAHYSLESKLNDSKLASNPVSTLVGETGNVADQLPARVTSSRSHRFQRAPVEREPALPELIVARRSSRLPSWLGQRSTIASDRESLAQGAMPPGRSEDDDLEAQASPTDVYDVYYEGGHYGEAVSRYSSGMMAPTCPQSVRQSQISVQNRRENDRITSSVGREHDRLSSLLEMVEQVPTTLTRPSSFAPPPRVNSDHRTRTNFDRYLRHSRNPTSESRSQPPTWLWRHHSSPAGARSDRPCRGACEGRRTSYSSSSPAASSSFVDAHPSTPCRRTFPRSHDSSA